MRLRIQHLVHTAHVIFPAIDLTKGAINQGSKVLKDSISFQENSAQKEVDDLIQEMKIMQEIGSHPHVVTILGVCTEQGENHLASKIFRK